VREKFVTVSKALRHSTAALLAGKPTERQLRLFNAIVADTASWSKLTELRKLSTLAAEAGLAPSWKTGADLRALADMGAIVYVPAIGRGRASTVGLVVPTEDSDKTPTLENKNTNAASRDLAENTNAARRDLAENTNAGEVKHQRGDAAWSTSTSDLRSKSSTRRFTSKSQGNGASAPAASAEATADRSQSAPTRDQIGHMILNSPGDSYTIKQMETFYPECDDIAGLIADLAEQGKVELCEIQFVNQMDRLWPGFRIVRDD
jgi:hypothetical protein